MNVRKQTTGFLAAGYREVVQDLRIPTQPISLEALTDLGQATTAYHEAPPDRVEIARQEYEEALRRFNASKNY